MCTAPGTHALRLSACCTSHSYICVIIIWLTKVPFRAIDVRHMRTGHNHALPSNPGTQWVVVRAGIAQERVVMARSQMPDVDRMLRRPSAAPPTAPVGAP